MKGELPLLDNKKGLSQSNEETDYDLNQEPESSSWLVGDDDVSNEEENVPNLLLSFSTPLISMMKSENKKDMMHFSSSTAPANHSIDSTSTSSFGNTYINLDLAI
ncbi:hypothetical protein DEO72_LG7g2927 [Vigna unguiculata]|uniref:Uncharacterized protein n=2 Tax=Vigna unguiculata TaxID=3917 RepID=A0A4D6MKU8_VIGUN|nr:hypothetical protein DEO72_LG7g2927 [Vigna unguiculata]